ncbi:SDR family NAD(P)-dependent oxidoreductase [Ferviditalea candida]|uniref:3-oxoacyl-ACP reductase family protein n=1 Tax=Ferviditalea candida TaxID=3108399 RepID=A0ABU5ZHH0_9BACL|nr:3-oxoacyl-ACP reductase family protein [Paenibacillaceae bacterium T2]
MRPKKLANKVAVVTGGSRGIGKGIALAFADEGADVVITYLSNETKARETVLELESKGARALAVKGNVGDEADAVKLRDEIQKTFGKINILVNNAGTIGKEMPLKDMPTEEWDKLMNVDLRGVFLVSKYLIPLFDSRSVGKIINISSELSLKGRANFTHYVTAKGGINSLTRALALELAPDILVNAIAPGPVETDMILADMDPEWIEKETEIPLGRLGKIDEIAPVAVLLASDDGNFFCGQFISPNGGAVFN